MSNVTDRTAFRAEIEAEAAKDRSEAAAAFEKQTFVHNRAYQIVQAAVNDPERKEPIPTWEEATAQAAGDFDKQAAAAPIKNVTPFPTGS